jgi:hypothetical protein
MSDDQGRYEAEVVRVGGGSGKRPIVVWVAGAALIVAFGVGGTLLSSPPAKAPTLEVAPTMAPVAVVGTPAPAGDGLGAATLAPLDITSGASGYATAFEARRRRSAPFVVESTDFHANSGSAYYGIGGKLLRALETKPPSPAP